MRLLSQEGDGEEILGKDLTELLIKLVSEGDFTKALPELVTAESFAEDILGFEEVDENEDEDEEIDGGAGGGIAGNTSAQGQSNLGVIQEEP